MTTDDLPELVRTEARSTAVIRGVVPMAELPAFFDRAFSTIATVLGGQDLEPVGAAFARYHGIPTDVVDLEVGFPTTTAVTPADDVELGSLPGGRVARFVHRGSYDGLGEAWGRLGAWLAEQGLQPTGEIWEVYLTEPTPEMDPAELRTELNWWVGD